MDINNVKISDLKAYDKNTKKHPEDQIEKIAASIKEFGFNVPVIIDKNNVLIAGHGRVLAAESLGMAQIPAIMKDNLSEAQIKAYRIADNKTAESAWEYDFLKEEFKDLQSMDYDLDLTGFSEQEINDIIDEDNQPEEQPLDDPKTIQTDIKIGDIFILGEHRLMCGDSTDKDSVEKLMCGNKADLFITDPPYSVNFTKKSKEVFNNKEYCEIKNDALSVNDTSNMIWGPTFKNAYLVSNDSASFYVFMPQGGDQMMMMMNQEWQVKHELIWEKESAVFSMNRLDYDYKHEPVMYGWKKNHNFYGNYKDKSILQINRDGNKSHPTMKPVDLLQIFIKNSSKKNQSVLDLFGGSGSTLIACEQTKRKCFMMELDPAYCQVIINRWQKLTTLKAVKVQLLTENVQETKI